ncbi:TIR domain-containing protein [Thiothrix litoralis]|uniref:TIR domain-containing protein n=1 Tax=Thiothrix litoralis TaxID=2891210 RepID=A0ABX7WVW5_9GAMM|nr:SEFIR domain-containing protein [Thiothrix litoralis]QTR47337.1 TIR domain-containing protein [Thiothrix litoralis]
MSPKVFISYSHDSDEHRQFVLELSEQLRDDGIDCFIDQYVNGAPPEGWQRWMKKQIEQAHFVLVVCTPIYLKRFDGEDPSSGRGVNFEGTIISQVLYDQFQQNTKFIPVIPESGNIDNVPWILKSGSTYKLNSDYEVLYRVLTNQPKNSAKPLGKLKRYPIGERSVPKKIERKFIMSKNLKIAAVISSIITILAYTTGIPSIPDLLGKKNIDTPQSPSANGNIISGSNNIVGNQTNNEVKGNQNNNNIDSIQVQNNYYESNPSNSSNRTTDSVPNEIGGYVYDAITKQYLDGVVVTIRDENMTTKTNGYFSFKNIMNNPKNKEIVSFAKLGYHSETIEIAFGKKDAPIKLKPE